MIRRILRRIWLWWAEPPRPKWTRIDLVSAHYYVNGLEVTKAEYDRFRAHNPEFAEMDRMLADARKMFADLEGIRRQYDGR